ncbi:hypothetical protein N9242_03410 [Vicingaceae bacterium]|nr:hypothetical protein [Vicingaceae bacterium]
MAIDKLFKQLERRTERDLYRKTFRMAHKSQQGLYAGLGDNLKKAKWKKIAVEVFWFFSSLAIGLVLGFLLFELIGSIIPSWKNNFTIFFGGSDAIFIYVLALICFIGVYITRLIVWSLNYLGR